MIATHMANVFPVTPGDLYSRPTLSRRISANAKQYGFIPPVQPAVLDLGVVIVLASFSSMDRTISTYPISYLQRQ